MDQVIPDFLRVGALRLLSQVLMAYRGLFIAISLVPRDFGEYAILLLYTFYFSILDFGILAGLERDIPHYTGENNQAMAQTVANRGWSTYFLFSFLEMALMCLVVFIVYKNLTLSILLGLYLITDKFYRAYESHSRINFHFQNVGKAQFILAAMSLGSILFLLPRFQIYGVLAGFIIASISSTFFLFWQRALRFNYDLHNLIPYIKGVIPLAIIIYSIGLFREVTLTVSAFYYDKSTIGYLAFALKIFQICLALFPLLIQELLRTRIYFHVAQTKGTRDLDRLLLPLGVYSMITALFWVLMYWWIDWAINYFAPQYASCIGMMKILFFSLIPLGICIVCGDYLCSHAYKLAHVVVLAWWSGIIFQVASLNTMFLNKIFSLLNIATTVVISTFIIYAIIGGYAFCKKKEISRGVLLLFGFLMPGLISFFVVAILKNYFGWMPSYVFTHNLLPFALSTLLISSIFGIFVFTLKYNERLRILFYPQFSQ